MKNCRHKWALADTKKDEDNLPFLYVFYCTKCLKFKKVYDI